MLIKLHTDNNVFRGITICIFPAWPVVFRKSGEFTIRRNYKLGELLVLGKEYVITFQLLLTAPSNDWETIIHFTIGGNRDKYGDRTPFLCVHHQTKLHLASAIDGNSNTYFNSPHLSLNTWHSIEISQSFIGSEVFHQ